MSVAILLANCIQPESGVSCCQIGIQIKRSLVAITAACGMSSNNWSSLRGHALMTNLLILYHAWAAPAKRIRQNANITACWSQLWSTDLNEYTSAGILASCSWVSGTATNWQAVFTKTMKTWSQPRRTR